VTLTDIVTSSRGDGYCPIVLATSASSGSVEEWEREVLRGLVADRRAVRSSKGTNTGKMAGTTSQSGAPHCAKAASCDSGLHGN
jgi:hypothetical protein